MRAILSKAPGLPDTLVLEDVPSPTPGKGEMVVSVKAVGVNFPDFLIIQDMYQYKPQRPFSPGGEFGGVVEQVAPDVEAQILIRPSACLRGSSPHRSLHQT